jgi:hypothetical protein
MGLKLADPRADGAVAHMRADKLLEKRVFCRDALSRDWH